MQSEIRRPVSRRPSSLKFKDLPAKLLRKRKLSPTTSAFTISFQSKHLSFIPGQFVMLEVPGFGEFAAGIASDPSVTNEIEVCVRHVGVATGGLHSQERGADLFVRGPLGNGFSELIDREGDLLMLCGGTGMPPIRSLVKFLLSGKGLFDNVTLLVGSRSPEELLYKHEYAVWSKRINVFPIVEHSDDEWTGTCGLIPQLIQNVELGDKRTAVMVGPPRMYDACLMELVNKKFKTEDVFMSLERNMKCGIGKCQHCVIGCKYTCLDGPVFSYREIRSEMPDALK